MKVQPKMTTDEKENLRAEVKEYLKSNETAAELFPLPAQANRGAMTPDKQEVAFHNWVEHIYSRPQNTWQPNEIEAVRFATNRVLREMGR